MYYIEIYIEKILVMRRLFDVFAVILKIPEKENHSFSKKNQTDVAAYPCIPIECRVL